MQGMVDNIIPIDPAYPYGCSTGTEITNFIGSIEDGSGPQENYDQNANGSWLINPQTAQDSVTSITLSFVVLDTENDDVITIYDGETTSDPVLGTYSGTTTPGENIYSTGNKILITFEADGDAVTGPGWRMEYSTTQPTWCSGLLTFGLGDKQRAFNFIDSLKLAKNLANLGDAKTLVLHPSSTIFHDFSTAEQNKMGVTEDMVRVSVGIEDFDDIEADFQQAIERAFKETK